MTDYGFRMVVGAVLMLAALVASYLQVNGWGWVMLVGGVFVVAQDAIRLCRDAIHLWDSL